MARTSPTDATGAATVVIDVKRTIDTAKGTGSGPDIDCGSEPGRCVLGAPDGADPTLLFTWQLLTFGPVAAPVPAETSTIEATPVEQAESQPPLARTGADIDRVLSVAALLLLAGGLALVRGQRLRSAGRANGAAH